MTIRFFCECGQKLKAPERKIGTAYDCPICGARVVVPEHSDPLAERAKPGLPADSATHPQEKAAEERQSAGKRELVGSAAVMRTGTASGSAPLDDSPDADERGAAEPTATSAASAARDLITRRIAKSHEVPVTEVEPEPKTTHAADTDYAAFAREMVRTLLPGVAAIVLFCGALYWLSSSMMSTRSLPDLGKVSGVVTLDGVALQGAIVTFQPVGAEEPGSRRSSSVGRTDQEGRFTLTYVRDVPGAVVGTHKVSVQAPLATGKETLPARYNARTELTEEVKAGNNKFEFKLESSK